MATRSHSKKNLRHKNSGQVLGIVFLCASIVAAGIIARPKPQQAQAASIPAPVVAQFDAIKLPVPVEVVAAGTKVKEIRFQMVAFPEHQVPRGALRNVEQILEAVTVATLPANLPIFSENFSFTAYSNNPVIEQIPTGMRAMTIRVDATSSVEGWAGSGAVVDVLLIRKDRTTVVAEKVKILSAERSVSPVDGSASPNVPSTVTLLVSQQQCLAINTAVPLGRIAFALRNQRDEQNWTTTHYTADRLRGGSETLMPRSKVTGFVSIKGEKNPRSFALSDGKWVQAESVPEGFFVADQE